MPDEVTQVSDKAMDIQRGSGGFATSMEPKGTVCMSNDFTEHPAELLNKVKNQSCVLSSLLRWH